MKTKILTTLVFTIFLSSNVFAHEYWLEPEKFALALNEKTPVHLYVGDGLTKDREERVFQVAKTPMFNLLSLDKMLDLKAISVEDAKPIYNFSGEKAGNYMLTMMRNWSFIKIESAKFENYLREDGMEYIIAEREKRGESKKEGRERYSRYIKSLFQVGGKNDDTYKKKIGLKLEITPLENPYLKKVGDDLAFQITFDGKPLASKTVFAENRDSSTQKMTTDKSGKLKIKIDKDGLWLVRLVFMRRCAETDCGEADWESFWAAYTFGMTK